MCGIFGYVGQDRDAAGIVLSGLKKLEYRGYDSWGVAVAHGGGVALEKRVGKIGEAVADLPPSAIGLGHTRWATHGGVTEDNAHPHLDCAGRLAVIHNGIVSNYRELRDALTRAGHGFRSETDTEVVAHLLEDALALTPEGPEQLVSALMATFRRLHGLNAVAVLDVRTGQLAAAKNGSPLVLGWSDSGSLLASDYSALLEHTRRVTFVEDGQAALVGARVDPPLRRGDGGGAGARDHPGGVGGRGRGAGRVPRLHDQGDPRAARGAAPHRRRVGRAREPPRRRCSARRARSSWWAAARPGTPRWPPSTSWAGSPAAASPSSRPRSSRTCATSSTRARW